MLIVSPLPFPLAPGFRFRPTKKEILCFYLPQAISGEPLVLPCNTLIEREIYGDNREPWNIFDKDHNDSFWVFSKLKKKSKSRIDRTAGSGTWLARSTKEVKDESGQLLGFEKYFTFIRKKDQSSRGINGNWIMHEFSLSDQGLSDYVICEIKNKDAMAVAVAVAVGSDHGQNNSTAKAEAVYQKRKALVLVNDEEMSVPTSKKICIDDQSNLNQGKAEWNGSTLTNNQVIFGEVDDQENQDPNKLPMIGSNSPEECEWNDMDLALFMNELN
ncbi:NAC domain-containing protein 68-like [Durio zibethinus]|uniref:NAC domain-containing protein 68-like n=1 Tax=Durio zibethinus TaxID=66656 RepID=A0A6P5ZNU5_DURZI|nr:NAC domain-containing protein 68-like [Durio zibethinus]